MECRYRLLAQKFTQFGRSVQNLPSRMVDRPRNRFGQVGAAPSR